MSKTKERKTDGDEEAKAFQDEGKDQLAPIGALDDPQEMGVADVLLDILAKMRVIPRANLLARLFDTIGKPKRQALCLEVDIPYKADPAVGVQDLLKAMNGAGRLRRMVNDPTCQEILLGYFGDTAELRKAKAIE